VKNIRIKHIIFSMPVVWRNPQKNLQSQIIAAA
jgi:hypothetical protein